MKSTTAFDDQFSPDPIEEQPQPAEKTMPLVIIESPFSGGEGIEIKVFEITSQAYKARAEIAGKRLRGFIERTPEAAINNAKRELSVMYARAAMRDCLQRGEAPYASHLLYTQDGVLDDDIPDERALGIEAGLQWGAAASKTVVYTDLGISDGMQQGIERAKAQGRMIEYRSLPDWSN